LIKLFSSTDKIFTTNGDKIIKAFKAVVHKEDNGGFYLDFECPVEYAEDIVENAILVVNLPQGEQAFRVSNVTKTKSRISTKAYHVFYDAKNYLIKDSYVVDKDCAGAMEHLNDATEPVSPFKTFSDITNTGSYRCVRKSLLEALEVVRERWGGHLVRDNFYIGLKENIGEDTGITIRYRKNLKDISCEEKWDDVVTKLLPVGKDGILLNDLDPQRSVYLVSSKVYSVPYTKTVSFSQNDIAEEDFTDEDGNFDEVAYKTALIENLELQGIKYLDQNKNPKITYTVKANLDNITDIGDRIEVIHEPLGLNLTATVIAFDYDCILKKYKEITFGNFGKKLSGLLNEVSDTTNAAITEQTNYLQNAFNDEIQSSTGEIWDLLDDYNVVYEGDKILVLDRLPKSEAQNVILIDKNGLSISSDGIYGAFNTVFSITGDVDFTTLSFINWGTVELGKAQNHCGQMKLYDGQNTLFAVFSKNGLKFYGKNNFYAVSNDKYFFAVYDGNDNLMFSLKNDKLTAKKGSFTDELTLGEKLRFLSSTSGVGIYLA
jgi:phage minor structural protein